MLTVIIKCDGCRDSTRWSPANGQSIRETEAVVRESCGIFPAVADGRLKDLCERCVEAAGASVEVVLKGDES